MKNYIPRRDMIYLGLAILTFFVFGWWGESIIPEDKPMETVSAVLVEPTATVTPTPEQIKPPYLRDDVPLSADLQKVLYETCEESGIDYAVGLALIEVESNFQSDAVSPCGSYGLSQLNPRYFPADLSDEDNIKACIWYLGELLDKHGDLEAALTAYNVGHDNGSRVYANKVLDTAKKWEVTL